VGLAVAAVALAAVVGPAHRAQAQAQEAEVVEISAERFAFTPSEFRTPVGVPVVLRLSSQDTDHGFRIVGTKVNVRIPKRNRGVIDVTFVPESAGRYTFECSHVCGAGHSFMRGAIVVTE
jgi:cytochrome c oxidase subunit 2